MEHLLSEWTLLAAGAFFAGLVDAVVGGGGLIQIPLLLSVFPQTAIPVLFGTNKVAAVVGTSSACIRYARAIPVPWRVASWAALAALIGSWFGAQTVAYLPKETMKPLVLALLVAVGYYTFRRKDFGKMEEHSLPARLIVPGALLTGGLIGFYDGFFGPGTGSFLIFAFVRWFGFDFLKASATAKFVNVATNLSAIVFFASHDGILWSLAAVMAVANLSGALVGSHLALRHGNGFVRWLFLGVVSVLVLNLGWELIRV
ncbi:TSUP family transporter [Niveibacterium sp. SC-1]|uniref:sulfite exporter TauE/SafE family protein n=1 Tax=Niveibacterium sp. SC-1 TaxID=3135646 RepID=UPI00311ED9EB